METIEAYYDVAIVGGGLAGLAASILLSRSGHSVILFEKEKYPFHKVCGEYISNESLPFLEMLGVPLQEMELPQINSLHLTSPSGTSYFTKLPLGGFGLSRFKLDYHLATIARIEGVVVLEQAKVQEIDSKADYAIHFSSLSTVIKMVKAKFCCAAFGKKSNLDVKWKRSYLKSSQNTLINFVGVKYHINSEWPKDTIGLHNFNGGYCGISRIEDRKYCLCYMTTADHISRYNKDVKLFEREVLYRNKHLQKIFTGGSIIDGFPVTISQINFTKKDKVEKDVLMLGDAAGLISPLCGNGMSIALHTGKIAARLISAFLNGKLSKAQVFDIYTKEWQLHFGKRMAAGRSIQKFFGDKYSSEIFVHLFKALPFLSKPVIRMTHGDAF
jgi:menaquinone-9 beta-reductase